MKDVKTSLLERTSVRRYTTDPIPAEVMDFIYEAVRNTPTSYNGQQFSVIDITDPEIKEQLSEITGQKQIKTCRHFLVFCADYHKAELLAKAGNLEFPAVTDTADGLIVAVIDASLAMMSAIVAAQASGLGSNCIGFLRTADPAKVAEILNLPKGVFVVCGLALGYPRETPDLKPKEPRSLVFHKDRYRDDTEAIVDEMKAYNDFVHHYNMTRSGQTTDNYWINHILGYYNEVVKLKILDYLKAQGYNITH